MWRSESVSKWVNQSVSECQSESLRNFTSDQNTQWIQMKTRYEPSWTIFPHPLENASDVVIRILKTSHKYLLYKSHTKHTFIHTQMSKHKHTDTHTHTHTYTYTHYTHHYIKKRNKNYSRQELKISEFQRWRFSMSGCVCPSLTD